ncbi:tetratricopeptide repeat-containing protein [Solimonas marina]|uniref:Guanylate cyclase domain-containing protein n=1 Tax=Solimonas marina TaxID=2714601 RepID=A0A970B790_9GAMM|nr:tetratricopeptide repeat-containing protein [Solimonas marina]NKF23633.1 hypothetical protein [Solimonas marina]
MSKDPLLTASGTARLALRDWLALHHRSGDGAAQLRVGACGHLMLSRREAAQVRRQLTDHVLPALVADGARRLSLFVGMAPGADMLFLETAAAWLREHELPFEMTALLPVPVDKLIADWVLRAEDEQRRVTRALRQSLAREAESLLQRCTTIVPLYPDDVDAAVLGSRSFRQQQYRRLAAILAQHADHLVAIMRPAHGVEPGGTAEIVAWREDAAQIPAVLHLHDAHCAAQRQTHLVDPCDRAAASHGAAEPPDTLTEVLRDAELARRAGNELQCHDIVNQAMRAGLRAPRLDYLRIQALANTGNVRAALDCYRALDLRDDEIDEDWLALHGRLQKDLALQNAADPTAFARAADAYAEAHALHNGSYSAINAASMYLLAGERRRAHQYARRALRQLRPPRNDLERFYAHATHAEAALLLGDDATFRHQLSAANRLLPDDFTRRGRTRQQLRRLSHQLGRDPAAVERLRMPPLVQLQTSNDADASSATLAPALLRHAAARAQLHLALCTPFDVQIGEQLVAHGARLHLSLPAPAAEIARRWRRRLPGVAHRLPRLLDAADGVASLQGFLQTEWEWATREARDTSLGLARLAAERLGQRLRIERLGAAIAAQGRRPPATGRAAERRMAGLVFADFASFRRLREPLFPRYYAQIMQSLAALLNRHREHILLRKTWGDALHVVTEDARTAAQIVADIQQLIEARRRDAHDVLADLELRIAAHYAPCYVGYDPIEERVVHYGTQLLFAARIEPVVPPGMIYVTEAFAARLTLEQAHHFALDYAGEVEFAKQFGTYRLYALQRRATPDRM